MHQVPQAHSQKGGSDSLPPGVRLQTNRQTERAFLRKRRNSGLGEFRFLQKNRNEQFSACSDVVEARGIEPLSENIFPKASPSAVCKLKFPYQTAGRQAERLGSFIIHGSLKALTAHVHHCVTPYPMPWYSQVRRPP